MNKLGYIFAVVGLLMLWACENEKALSPLINVKKIVVCSEDTIHCAAQEIPGLKEGDEIDILLDLDGNGSNLKSLNISSSEKNVVTCFEYREENQQHISDTQLTNKEEGMLYFVDGVTHFSLVVRAKVGVVQEDDLKIKAYLSARAECESGVLELNFKVKEKN